eukprot:6417071-Pyramimonas_sp.AAC.1
MSVFCSPEATDESRLLGDTWCKISLTNKCRVYITLTIRSVPRGATDESPLDNWRSPWWWVWWLVSGAPPRW